MALYPGKVVPFSLARRTLYQQGLPSQLLPYAVSGVVANNVRLTVNVAGTDWTGLAVVTRQWQTAENEALLGALTGPHTDEAAAAAFNAYGDTLATLLGLPTPALVNVSGAAATALGLGTTAHIGYVEVQRRNLYPAGQTSIDDPDIFYSRIFLGFVTDAGARVQLTGSSNSTGGVVATGALTLTLPGGQGEPVYRVGPDPAKTGHFQVETVATEPVLDAIEERATRTVAGSRTEANVFVAPQAGRVVVSGLATAPLLTEEDVDGQWALDAEAWTLRGCATVDANEQRVTLERVTGSG